MNTKEGCKGDGQQSASETGDVHRSELAAQAATTLSQVKGRPTQMIAQAAEQAAHQAAAAASAAARHQAAEQATQDAPGGTDRRRRIDGRHSNHQLC